MKKNIKILVMVFIVLFVEVFSFIDIVKGEIYITGNDVNVSVGGAATILNYSRDLVRPMVKITMVNSTGTTIYGSSAIFKLRSGAENASIYSPNKTNAKVLSTRCDANASKIDSFLAANDNSISVPKFDELSVGCNMNLGDSFVNALINDLEDPTIVNNVIRTLCAGCTSSDINNAYFIIEPVFMWGLKTRSETETKPYILIGTGREMYSHIYDTPNKDIEYIIYGAGGKNNPDEEQTKSDPRVDYLKILLNTMKPTNTSVNKLIYENYYGVDFKTTAPSFNANGKCGNESCLNYALGFGIFKVSDFLPPESCEYDFNSANSDGRVTMPERVSIYLKYKNHSNSILQENYNAMLNEKNKTADTACATYTCDSTTKTPSVSCFNVFYGSDSFGTLKDASGNSYTDLSCYNYEYKYEAEKVVGLCNLSFELENLYTFNTPFTSKAGRLLFEYAFENGVFATSNISVKCYAYKNDGNGNYRDYTDSSKFSSTFGTLKASMENSVLDVELENVGDLENEYVDEEDNSVDFEFTSNVIEYVKPVNFKFRKVYSKLISGESINITEDNKTDLDIEIGYGPFSKLNTKITDNFAFSYNFKFSTIPANSGSAQCDYSVMPKVITPGNGIEPDNLNLEFRVVDTDNPFAGKNGGTRKVGSNWAINYSSETDISILDTLQLLNLVNAGTDDLQYDYTGDGIVDLADVYVLFSHVNGRCELKEGLDNESNNCLVEGVMLYTNNSYDKNETGPIYKITLTPDTILKIREYNENNLYDDLNLSKDSTTGKYVSNFLNEFANGTIDGTPVTGTFERFVVE